MLYVHIWYNNTWHSDEKNASSNRKSLFPVEVECSADKWPHSFISRAQSFEILRKLDYLKIEFDYEW